LAFHITLKGMENGRSPGSDGLTKEFYFKTSFYSVFDNSCYPDNNANHMLLTSDLNSFSRDCAHAPL
jgi:hypothetical protein